MPERAIALEGERITVRPVQRSVGAVGSFFGYDEVTVTAEVSGRVAKVLHDVGDIVSPGDVLMELDTTDFELELEQTRRALGAGSGQVGCRGPAGTRHHPTRSHALCGQFDIKTLPSLDPCRETGGDRRARDCSGRRNCCRARP